MITTSPKDPATSPKDPATALELQAEGLHRTNAARQDQIRDLAKEIAKLSDLIDRDEAFAAQYDAAAAELRKPKVQIFEIDPSLFGGRV